jgi:hypothetical protein
LSEYIKKLIFPLKKVAQKYRLHLLLLKNYPVKTMAPWAKIRPIRSPRSGCSADLHIERNGRLIAFQWRMGLTVNKSAYIQSGLPDFFGTTYPNWKNVPNNHTKHIPNGHKIFQMAIKYTKWPQNISNGHKIYQMATKYTKWPQNYQMATKLPNGRNIGQMVIQYTSIFHCKSLQNFPKVGFLV